MADVIIAGGGIIGSVLAYYLSREKIKVLVIEKEGVGQQASQGAVGFLTIDTVPFAHDTLRRAAIESRKTYLTLAEEFQKTIGASIELEHCGTLRVAKNETDLASLKEEINWHRQHVAPVDFLDARELRRRFPAVAGETVGGFFYPQDIQVTSSRVTNALRMAAVKLGATFLEHKEITGWDTGPAKVNAIIADGYRYEAGQFILAAGSWSERLGSLLNLEVPVYPVRGQLLIFEMKERFLPCPIIAGGAHESFYLGPKQEGCIYAGTTLEEAGFNAVTTDEALEKIGEEVCKIVPRVKDLPVKGSWAGLRPATRDKLPIIGPAPGWQNLLLATGHFRKGVLLAPWTGRVITELVVKGASSFPLEEFSPLRFTAQSRK